MSITKRISFTGHNQLQLAGRLELPDATPRYFAIFCHCFTCTKDIPVAYRISKQLAQLGIATLRFDFAGLGDSAGEFADTSFGTSIADLLAAAAYLEQEYTAPQLLIGHSLGGTAALACAPQLTGVNAVITIASPSRPEHVLHHFGKALAELRAGNTSSILVAGRRYEIRPQFLDDIQQHDMRSLLAKLNKPVLIFSVLDDSVVEHSDAEQIQQWTNAETTLVKLTGTDHIISDKPTAAVIAEQIAAFIS